jgi:hypothetical protein
MKSQDRYMSKSTSAKFQEPVAELREILQTEPQFPGRMFPVENV